MNKKDKNYVNELVEETEGKTLSIFCYDTMYVGEAFRSIVQQIFSKEVMSSLQELGKVLKGVHSRLISEGYVFTNGKYYKNNNDIKNI